jgi:SPP1 family predicted phage head-tail adaptor
MPEIASGQRDCPVTIQSLTEGIDTSQFPTEDWSTLATVYAHREDRGGREHFVIDQTSAPYDMRWTIPYMPAMDPADVDVRKARRLVFRGRIHDIVAAEEVQRRRGVTLYTVAGGLLE